MSLFFPGTLSASCYIIESFSLTSKWTLRWDGFVTEAKCIETPAPHVTLLISLLERNFSIFSIMLNYSLSLLMKYLAVRIAVTLTVSHPILSISLGQLKACSIMWHLVMPLRCLTFLREGESTVDAKNAKAPMKSQCVLDTSSIL